MRDLRHFAIYLTIGSLVFALDAGSFVALMHAHVTLAPAATFSYLIGLCAHFTLNRMVNFRNFERSLQGQFRTYVVVVTFCYLITMVTIEGGVRLFHLTPFAAKVLAVVINIPTGFLAHRYLTFSGGIRAALERLQAHVSGRQAA